MKRPARHRGRRRIRWSSRACSCAISKSPPRTRRRGARLAARARRRRAPHRSALRSRAGAALVGDLEATAARLFAGDRARALRYLQDEQGTLILAALRAAGLAQPALFVHDFPPRRLANLRQLYGDVDAVPSARRGGDPARARGARREPARRCAPARARRRQIRRAHGAQPAGAADARDGRHARARSLRASPGAPRLGGVRGAGGRRRTPRALEDVRACSPRSTSSSRASARRARRRGDAAAALALRGRGAAARFSVGPWRRR